MREDEAGMMRELDRIIAANPDLRWDADWIRRVYERHVRQQELEELVRSEEEACSESGWRDFIEAGAFDGFPVDVWLEEYVRLGLFDPPHMLPDGSWDDDIATG